MIFQVFCFCCLKIGVILPCLFCFYPFAFLAYPSKTSSIILSKKGKGTLLPVLLFLFFPIECNTGYSSVSYSFLVLMCILSMPVSSGLLSGSFRRALSSSAETLWALLESIEKLSYMDCCAYAGQSS